MGLDEKCADFIWERQFRNLPNFRSRNYRLFLVAVFVVSRSKFVRTAAKMGHSIHFELYIKSWRIARLWRKSKFVCLINYIYHFKFYLFSNEILIKIKVIKVNKFIKSNEELISNFFLFQHTGNWKLSVLKSQLMSLIGKMYKKAKKMYIYDSEAFFLIWKNGQFDE